MITPGSPRSGAVSALTIDSDGKLHVGGSFTTIGSSAIAANRVAYWWPEFVFWGAHAGGFDNTVNSLAAMGSEVYAGGAFINSGGSPVNRIARLHLVNSTRWLPLGSGFNNYVDAIAVLAAAEQGHGLALARWSLVAGDLASGRLVRPSLQSVRQSNSYYFVAPAHNFEVPKVIRFRDWLREVCNQFPPPEGERLEPQ